MEIELAFTLETDILMPFTDIHNQDGAMSVADGVARGGLLVIHELKEARYLTLSHYIPVRFFVLMRVPYTFSDTK
jgi:hypothetical protein